MAHYSLEGPQDFCPMGFESEEYPAETQPRSCSMLLHRSFSNAVNNRDRLRENLVVLLRAANFYRALEHQHGFWDLVAYGGLDHAGGLWAEKIVTHYVKARRTFLSSPRATTRTRDNMLARLVDRWESRPTSYAFPQGVDEYWENAKWSWEEEYLHYDDIGCGSNEFWPKPPFAPAIAPAPREAPSPRRSPGPFESPSSIVHFPQFTLRTSAGSPTATVVTMLDALNEIPDTAATAGRGDGPFFTERIGTSSTFDCFYNICFDEMYLKRSAEELRLADYLHGIARRDRTAGPTSGGSGLQFYVGDERIYVEKQDGALTVMQGNLFSCGASDWSSDEHRLACHSAVLQTLQGTRGAFEAKQLLGRVSVHECLQLYYERTRELNATFGLKTNSWISNFLDDQEGQQEGLLQGTSSYVDGWEEQHEGMLPLQQTSLSTSPSRSTSPVHTASPVQPTSPVYPYSPVHPISPVRLASPVHPTSPVQPASPGQPASPVRPASPVQSSSPGQSASPGQLASPGQHISPVRFASPVRPASPDQLASPGRPISPVRLASPVRPASPVQPSSPVQSPPADYDLTNDGECDRRSSHSRTYSSDSDYFSCPSPSPKSARELNLREPASTLNASSWQSTGGLYIIPQLRNEEAQTTGPPPADNFTEYGRVEDWRAQNTDVNVLKRTVQDLVVKVKETKATMQERGRAEDELRDTVKEMESTIQRKSKTENELRDIIEEMKSTIQEKDDTLDKLEGAVRKVKAGILERTKREDELRDTVKEMKSTIQANGKAGDELRNTIEEMKATIQEKGNALDELSDTVKARGKTIGSQEKRIRAQGEIIGDQEERIGIMEKTIDGQAWLLWRQSQVIIELKGDERKEASDLKPIKFPRKQ